MKEWIKMNVSSENAYDSWDFQCWKQSFCISFNVIERKTLDFKIGTSDLFIEPLNHIENEIIWWRSSSRYLTPSLIHFQPFHIGQ